MIRRPRGDDQLEQLLRANRPQPRDQFVTSMLGRLDTRRRGLRPQRITARILVAAAVTALALGAAVAAGGTHTVATSITGLINVAKHGVNTPSQPTSTVSSNGSNNGNGNGNNGNGNGIDNAGNGHNGNNGNGAGDNQYSVTICHHTGSSKNPWIELTLSPQGAANHLKNHPEDFIVTPSTPCPPTG
jgi:hypothetical protein